MLLLPLLLVMTVVSEAFQRSVGGAATAAVAVSSGGGGASSALGIFGGVSGTGGGVGGGAVGGGAGTGIDVGQVLEGAGNVVDTLFVAFSVWYMLRFFR